MATAESEDRPIRFRSRKGRTGRHCAVVLLACLLLAALVPVVSAGNCQLQAAPTEVNAQGSYRFRLRTNSEGTRGILFEFPKSAYFAVAGATAAGSSGFFSATPTITVLASSATADRVLVQDADGIYKYYDVTLNGVENPGVATTVRDIRCTACNNAAEVAAGSCASAMEVYQANPVSFQPAVLATDQVRYTSSSLYNGDAPVDLTVRVTLGNDIVPQGQVAVKLPNKNEAYRGQGYSALPLIQDENNIEVEITYGAQNSGSYAAVPLVALPQAPASGQRFRYEYEVDGTGQRLYIKLDNPAAIAKNGFFFIKIKNCRNPPSLAPLQGFEFFSGDQSPFNVQQIEKATGGQLETAQPGRFSAGSVLEVMGTTVVSAQNVEYKFTVALGNDVPRGSGVYVYPPLIDNKPTLDCSVDYVVTSIQGIGPADRACNPNDNRLELLSGFPNEQDYLAAPNPFIFSVKGFNNPPTTEPVYYVVETIHFLDGNPTPYSIDRAQREFQVQATTGRLSVGSITPNQTEIYFTEGTYKFTLTPDHDVETDYQFQISFPPAFGVMQNSACTVSGLGSRTTCTADATNKQIILGQLFDSTVTGGTAITFVVNSIQNPGIYDSPGQIEINMTTRSGGPIDTGSFTMPANLYSPTNILQFYAYADNSQAGAVDVIYRFKLQPRQRVAKEAYLVLQLPSELTVANRDELTRNCHRYQGSWLSGFAYSYLQCNYDPTTNTVKVLNGFKTNASAADPPILQWSIPGISNPRAVVTTGPFNVTIYDRTGKVLYFFNDTNAPTVTMTSFQQPNAVNYTRSSYQNGVPSNYSWRVQASNYLQGGDKLVWKLPHPIVFSRNSTIIGASYWVKGVQPTRISGAQDEITMTLTLSTELRRRLAAEHFLANEEAFKKLSPLSYRRRLQRTVIPKLSPNVFIMTNIASLPSVRPVEGSISFKILSATGDVIEALDSDLFIANTEPGEIDPGLSEAVASYFEKNKTANYTFSFTPVNFERNMRMYVGVPAEVKVPDPPICFGLNGTDKRNLTCEHLKENNTLLIPDGFTTMDISRGQVVLFFENFTNPEDDVETAPFTLQTKTYDYYAIDNMLSGGPTINFVCVFPCKTCNLSQPTQCFSCYWQTTEYKYLYEDRCLQNCSTGLYEILTPEQQTCDLCQPPCASCTINATYCETCLPGYQLYEKDRTCFEIINWPFPFLFGASFFFLLVLCVDCFRKSTNFLQALLFFLSFLEVGVWCMLLYLWIIGRVQGTRGLSAVSLGVQILLNIVFIPVHIKLMMSSATPEYRQVFQEYKCSSWFMQGLAYVLNFKMSLILISQFASRPRFSGTYGQDSWQKFNIFAVLYIVLVYLPFMADFYIYFNTYGLRQFASYVGIEAVVIMTIICLILLLEILQQCQCAGILERDLGKRAGLSNELKKGKKKRRAARSGMGNDESDYGDYDSEHDYYLEDDDEDGQEESEEEDEEGEYDEEDEDDEDEEVESEDSKGNKVKKKGSKAGSAAFKKMQQQNKQQLQMLEKLASQIKKEKAIMKEEHEKVLKTKMDVLNEKEKYFNDADKLKQGFDDDTKKLMNELKDMEKHKVGLVEAVDQRIDEKIAQSRAALALPKPVLEQLEQERGAQDEYGLQNMTPPRGDVSDKSKVKELDASTIQYMSRSQAKLSQLDSIREGEDNQEQRARMSTGPVKGDDLSIGKSIHATEKNFLNRSNNDGASAIQGLDDGSRDRTGTEKDFYDKASAIFSNADGTLSRNATQKNLEGQTPEGRLREGTDIDAMDRKSAAFGSISELQKQGSQQDFIDKSDAAFDKDSQVKELVGPHVDQTGRSSESSEGIVADHAPFKGIKDAMRDQDKLRRDAPPEGSSEEEDNRPSARRRIKQVLYSDKSESSVDDMMEDTPSNYNIANGRLEGKSMGLKAILLFAKNQGIALGGDQANAAAAGGGFRPGQQLNGPLPQIQEEAAVATPGVQREGPHNSSTEGVQWKAMNQPITDRRTTVLDDGQSPMALNNTIDLDGSQGMRKKQPPKKQFKEPGDNDELAKLQKNNFV